MIGSICFLIAGLTIFFAIKIASVKAIADEVPAITEPCGLTVEELADATGGNLAQYADWFLQGERMTDDGETCVNALFLASIAKLESGDGKSRLAVNRNNLFGWRGKDGWKSFGTPETCILFVADRIKRNYVDKGYTTIDLIGSRYCPGDDGEWGRLVSGIYFKMNKGGVYGD